MCQICDGLTLEEVLAEYAATIAEQGFKLIAVDGRDDGGDEDHGPWAYTVGLLDAVGHPEMVMAGVEIEACGSLLPLLASSVLAGNSYGVGETIELRKGFARVGAVDAIHYELSTFNMWHNLQRCGVVHTQQLEAVQIVMPPTFFCSCHPDAQPRLDDPDARVDGPRPRRRPNRAERRRYRPRR